MHVPWFEPENFVSSYLSISPDFVLISIVSASSATTVPPRFAITTTPESYAALYSIPVPTTGASVLISGTA